VAGTGFLIAGVPGALLLALLTFFFSAVVPFGPPLVWIPATLWLFHQGNPGWGIFMAIWGLGVSSVDNVVRPLLIQKETNLPFVLVFLGVLGGILTFGFIGVFLGPTLLAVGYKILVDWVATRPGIRAPDAEPAREA
jgi:predicted PurR-regulated permease PerM